MNWKHALPIALFVWLAPIIAVALTSIRGQADLTSGNYWGIPRTTHDLDFVVQLPMSAVPRIVQEFSGDFYIEEAAVWAVYQPPHQFNAIDTRSALKVDFWLARPEPFDDEMLRRRARVTPFGEPPRPSTKSGLYQAIQL